MKKMYEYLKRKVYGWLEYCMLVKGKSCCVCKHFGWFMGSAGVCKAKDGCCTSRMKDCMDTCDCGKFKKEKWSW